MFVNIFHTQIVGMRTRTYFEWVASAANIADWPTRDDKIHLIPKQAIRVPLVLPDTSVFEGPLENWIEKVKIASRYGAS